MVYKYGRAMLAKYLKFPNIFFGYQPRYHMGYLGYIQLLGIRGLC